MFRQFWLDFWLEQVALLRRSALTHGTELTRVNAEISANVSRRMLLSVIRCALKEGRQLTKLIER